MKSLMSKPVPNQDAKYKADAEKMLKEATVFAKGLSTFKSQLQSYETQTYKLASSCEGVAEGTAKDRITAIKTQMKQQLATNVYEPIAQFMALHKTVAAEVKDLDKKCSTYGKCEQQLCKAQVKKEKAENNGLGEDKRAKLTTACQQKDTSYEMAKSAYLAAAPQVVKDCQLLLEKRDALRTNIFSAFTYSANALNQVASINNKGNGGM